MKKYLLAVCLLISASAFADTYPKNPKIDILNYAFRIRLSDSTDVIRCITSIDVRYAAAGVESLRLDLVNVGGEAGDKGMKVTSVTSDGKDLTFTHSNNVLLIKLPGTSTMNQRSRYIITYSGIPASGLKIANNKYGDRTFFSDNWPDKGRHWLPIVDHPYDKATCEFIVTAPNHYQVVSNGLLVEETDLDNNFRVTHWRQSVPIASWLYVLGVARFAMQQVGTFDHKAIQTWVYTQDKAKGFYDFAVPTKRVLEYYSSYVGPFVYEKLANIQSNSVSGGMEAASAILYSESSVVGDRNERWRNVIIHEIAHQWFGNSVTEYDWDDVWLSEGFATYFTLLFIQHEYGHEAFKTGLADAKKTVDAFNEKNPGYRIIHDQLSDMSKVTSSHTYQKGAWVLHMLRGMIGENDFWEGIRSYYRKYQNGSATTADFRSEMEDASGKDLSWFFDQWLYKPGALRLNGAWTYDKKTKEVKMTLDQVQADGSSFRMPMQVAIYHTTKSKPVKSVIEINSKSNIFTFPLEYAPEKIVLDPDGWVLMDVMLEKR